jgi:hypothetical protein
MMRLPYWPAIRGFIGGTIVGVAIVLGLMWSAGNLDRWQTRSGSITLTILLFALAGAVGGLYMGRSSNDDR